MNWDDMQLFHAAAAAGSMTGAARRLRLSQPQLSRRLRQLEDSCGARLFDRTPQGLKLTRAGETLLPHAEQMRKAADAVSRVTPKLASRGLGRIRLSVDDMRVQFLNQHITELLAAVGDVELEFVSTHQHLNLTNRTTDLQIRTCLPDTDTMIVRKLADVSFAVYGTAAHLGVQTEQSLEDLCATGTWIGFSSEPQWYPEQFVWMEEHVTGAIPMRFNCIADCYGAAKAGVGLAILPCFLGEQDASLLRVGEPLSELSGPEHVIVDRDLLREPAIRTVIDALAKIYRHMI